MGRLKPHTTASVRPARAAASRVVLVAALGLSLAVPSMASAQEKLKKADTEGLSNKTKQSGQSGQSSGQAGQSGQSSGQNQPTSNLDRKQVTPPLVKKMRQKYQQIQGIWNKRDLPAAIAEPSEPPQPRDSGTGSVGIEIKNIDFYTDDKVGYHVKRLKGEMIPVNKGDPVDFNRPSKFRIHILSGEVLIRARDMDALFNNYILTYEPRSLGWATNHMSDGTLKVNAGARLFQFAPPVGGLPTVLKGSITVAKDNWLVYAPESAKSLGILPMMPLLHLTPLKLSMLTPLDLPAVKLVGNKLRFDPEKIFPPPRLKIDKISKVKLTKKGLILGFDSSASNAGFSKPPVDADSYIFLQGGDALFYDALLVNARLQLLSDNDEPLDFYLYDYRAQAAEGTIKMKRDGSVVERVPNKFDDDDDTPGVKLADSDVPEIRGNNAPKSKSGKQTDSKAKSGGSGSSGSASGDTNNGSGKQNGDSASSGSGSGSRNSGNDDANTGS